MGGVAKKATTPLGFAVNPILGITQKGISTVTDLFKGSPTVNPPAPPAIPDMPKAQTDDPIQTSRDRQKKLAALQYGFASTVTNKASLGAAPSALKTTLGS